MPSRLFPIEARRSPIRPGQASASTSAVVTAVAACTAVVTATGAPLALRQMLQAAVE